MTSGSNSYCFIMVTFVAKLKTNCYSQTVFILPSAARE